MDNLIPSRQLLPELEEALNDRRHRTAIECWFNFLERQTNDPGEFKEKFLKSKTQLKNLEKCIEALEKFVYSLKVTDIKVVLDDYDRAVKLYISPDRFSKLTDMEESIIYAVCILREKREFRDK